MAQRISKELIKARIKRLKNDPVTNAKLIKKWERKLRRYEEVPVS